MIPVIMLTSMDDQDSKLKAFELGAVDYIVKSANAAEIKARVRVHIRLALANRELLRQRTDSVRQIAAAQHALLPKSEDLPKAGFAGYYRAVHEAGGDFYDVIPVADGVPGQLPYRLCAPAQSADAQGRLCGCGTPSGSLHPGSRGAPLYRGAQPDYRDDRRNALSVRNPRHPKG